MSVADRNRLAKLSPRIRGMILEGARTLQANQRAEARRQTRFAALLASCASRQMGLTA